MKNNKKKLVSLIFVGCGILLFLVALKLTVFYDYVGRIEKNVDAYILNNDKEVLNDLNEDLGRIKNNEKKVMKLNNNVKERFLMEYESFIKKEFNDFEDFEAKFRDLHKIVEDIYNVNKTNNDGKVVRILSEDGKEDVLYVYGSTYTSLSKYYNAKTFVDGKDYNNAYSLLKEIENDKELGDKVKNYEEEIIDKIVTDIKNNAEKMEKDVLNSNNKSEYKYIINYLKEVKDDYKIDISEDEEYLNLLKEMNNKYTSYLSENDTSYNVSKFKKISLDELIKKIENKENILVFLGRETCPYCVRFVPVLNESLKLLSVPIYYVDASTISYSGDVYKKFNEIAPDYSNAYPTLVYFKKGEAVDGIVGYTEYNRVEYFYKTNGLMR